MSGGWRVAKLLGKTLFAALFLVAGVSHFTRADFLVKAMPPYLPYPLELVYISGVFELALGVLLLVPANVEARRLGAGRAPDRGLPGQSLHVPASRAVPVSGNVAIAPAADARIADPLGLRIYPEACVDQRGPATLNFARRSRSLMNRPTRSARLIVFCVVIGVGPGNSPGSDDPARAFDPTDHYERRQVEGWTILVNQKFLKDQPELAERALTLLKFQLYQIDRRLPAESVAELRKIKIWLEEAEPHHPCMAYHPDPGWLKDHRMNPDKARCVEIANAQNFLAWTFDQPWMVLHELAHSYHHQALADGFANREIKTLFEHAMKAGHYKSVLRLSGKAEKAYATTDPMEYFAEATEAYFGTNDFFPFVRPELKKHDPDLFATLGKLWGDRP